LQEARAYTHIPGGDSKIFQNLTIREHHSQRRQGASGLNWLTTAGAGMKVVWASLQLLVFYLAGKHGLSRTS
jgi:hypothetical protein